MKKYNVYEKTDKIQCFAQLFFKISNPNNFLLFKFSKTKTFFKNQNK